jgi:hypothetical protein
MTYVWILTETIMDDLHTRVNLWDHDLNVFVFTSEERAQNYLKGLKLVEKELDDDESNDGEADTQTRWFIKKHELNPDFSVDGQHYDEDSLMEQNPR